MTTKLMHGEHRKGHMLTTAAKFVTSLLVLTSTSLLPMATGCGNDAAVKSERHRMDSLARVDSVRTARAFDYLSQLQNDLVKANDSLSRVDAARTKTLDSLKKVLRSTEAGRLLLENDSIRDEIKSLKKQIEIAKSITELAKNVNARFDSTAR